MRQRNIKNLDEKLAALSEFAVSNPKDIKGRWKEVFGNRNPVYLEIGCGKGKFITQLAADNPEKNYIAIEGQESVVLRAFEKAAGEELKNLKIIIQYVDDLYEIFENGEIDGIYLNFSDPWPKARHAKRRLTYRGRLKQYADIISTGGFVEFKTDNDGLFEFSLEQIEEQGLTVTAVTRDLHQSDFAAKKYTTEYEDKFRNTGKNINYVRITV